MLAILNSMLQTTINQVLALDDLRPSSQVNELFERLVALIVNSSETSDNFPPALQARVRGVASASEAALEMHWAERIIMAVNPAAELARFPYTCNYALLVGREIGLVEASGRPLQRGQRLLMIGSGSLPMTALEFASQRGMVVDHVDISASAIEACRTTSECLGVSGDYIVADGRTVTLEREYDVILVAGLAGETIEEKQAIIDQVLPSLKSNGRLLVRSASGLRSLLYPAVRATDFTNIELLSEYHPTDEVINSVFIYKKEQP